jgi:hypothetical protein
MPLTRAFVAGAGPEPATVQGPCRSLSDGDIFANSIANRCSMTLPSATQCAGFGRNIVWSRNGFRPSDLANCCPFGQPSTELLEGFAITPRILAGLFRHE